MLERFYNSRDIAVLKGKTVVAVDGLEECSREITFRCSDGSAYRMYHQQDGDEVVIVTSIDRLAGFYKVPDCVLRNPFGEDEPEAREEWAEKALMRRVTDAFLNAPVTLAERVVLDRELLPAPCDKTAHNDPHGSQKTIYIIATTAGVIAITWNGISDDDRESTEIDFVQVEGEGVWKEADH